MVETPAPLPFSPSGENPVWNLLDVLLIFIVAFVAIFVSALALIVVELISQRSLDLSPADMARNTPLLVAIQTLAYLIVVGFMLLIVRLKYNEPFLKSISWNMPPWNRVIPLLLAGALLAGFSEGASLLLSHWIPKSLPIDEFFRTRASAYSMMFFGIAVAPLSEELFFRGFLYPALARHTGVAVSVLLTSALFALLHAGQLAHAWVPLLIIFVVGSTFTVVRARTKSVATTVLIHVGYNSTLFTALFIGTQGFRHLGKP
jgi:hypothetical protein